MQNALATLKSLQQRIADRNELDIAIEYLPRLTIVQTGKLFHLDFYGNPFEDSYLDTINTVAQAEIAPLIRSLIFRSYDEGANGTLSWDIEPLLNTDVTFSELKTFTIQLNQPGQHNRSIVAADYDEDGVLAKLLQKSPNLAELTVPSAPDASFFNIGDRPICHLNIDAGYDTQDFISNLAKSSCFPHLYRVSASQKV